MASTASSSSPGPGDRRCSGTARNVSRLPKEPLSRRKGASVRGLRRCTQALPSRQASKGSCSPRANRAGQSAAAGGLPSQICSTVQPREGCSSAAERANAAKPAAKGPSPCNTSHTGRAGAAASCWAQSSIWAANASNSQAGLVRSGQSKSGPTPGGITSPSASLSGAGPDSGCELKFVASCQFVSSNQFCAPGWGLAAGRGNNHSIACLGRRRSRNPRIQPKGALPSWSTRSASTKAGS